MGKVAALPAILVLTACQRGAGNPRTLPWQTSINLTRLCWFLASTTFLSKRDNIHVIFFLPLELDTRPSISFLFISLTTSSPSSWWSTRHIMMSWASSPPRLIWRSKRPIERWPWSTTQVCSLTNPWRWGSSLGDPIGKQCARSLESMTCRN